MTSSLLVAPPPVERSGASVLQPRLSRIRYEPDHAALAARVEQSTLASAALIGPPGSPDPAHPAPAIPQVTRQRPTTGSRPTSRRGRGVGPAATPAERLDAQHAVARQLRMALEVFDGRRPATHLADLATPAVLRYWRSAARERRARGPARFSRMRICLPRSGVAEVAVTCEIDGRSRALAARFEHTHDRWRCTALRLG